MKLNNKGKGKGKGKCIHPPPPPINSRYDKMIKMGIPKDAVLQKMRLENNPKKINPQDFLYEINTYLDFGCLWRSIKVKILIVLIHYY